MPEFPEVSGIAHVIQLAVAPVFLLTGIGAILAVMTNRLGRIIDRARVLEVMLNAASPEMLPVLRNDLATLSRRAKLISFAITLCTTTALLICMVIAILFLSAFLHFDAHSCGFAICCCNVGVFSRAAVVPTGDLRCDGQPAHRPSVRRTLLKRLMAQVPCHVLY